MFRLQIVIVLFCVFAVPLCAPSQEKDEAKPKTDATQKSSGDDVSVTKHEIKIGGDTISYTATAGTWEIKSEQDEKRADFFFIAYTRDDADAESRPLTFAFNGGPGSSSVWLHMGLLGPKKIDLSDDDPAQPLSRLVPNLYSILDRTDLVFLDPISTGYSRPAKEEDKGEFHGYEEDLKSVGEFIHLYVTRNNRWLSPKFLLGESYGTLRAAGLAGHLQQTYNMELSGIVLVSSVIDFSTIRFAVNNDLPYVLFLPTYTATAWYHKKLPDDLMTDLEQTVDEAERFALGDYAEALLQGDSLPEEQRRKVVEQLARYTGLSPEYIEHSNLRINIFRFTKELLRDERRTVGRFDSRFVGIDRDAAGERFEYDPSGAIINGPFTSTLYHYIRDELQVKRDMKYEILTSRVRPWNYKQFENRYVNSIEALRQAMSKNPRLQVFVANGYFDLATPHFATEYTFNHLGLDRTLQKNVQMNYYRAGHMMYIDPSSLQKLKRDLDQFYDRVAGPAGE